MGLMTKEQYDKVKNYYWCRRYVNTDLNESVVDVKFSMDQTTGKLLSDDIIKYKNNMTYEEMINLNAQKWQKIREKDPSFRDIENHLVKVLELAEEKRKNKPKSFNREFAEWTLVLCGSIFFIALIASASL